MDPISRNAVLRARSALDLVATSAPRWRHGDLKDYSLKRAMDCARENKLTGLEGEVSVELSRQGGKELFHAVMVPWDVLVRRDLNTATGGGSNLVPTNVEPVEELVRGVSVVGALGARVVNFTDGSAVIPVENATPTAEWLTSETDAGNESQPTVGGVNVTPKTAIALVDVGRTLRLMAPQADAYIASTLRKTVGALLDRTALQGSGANGEPLGVFNVSGVGTVDGTSLNHAKTLEFQTDIGDNLDAGCGYATTRAVAAVLAQRHKVTNTHSPIWEGSVARGQIQGHAAITSSHVPTGGMVFGNWSDLIVATWGGGIVLDSNPYGANFLNGVVTMRVLWTGDVVIARPASFSVAASVT